MSTRATTEESAGLERGEKVSWGGGIELDSAPAALMYGTAVRRSVITSSNPRPVAGRGAHSIVSFAIEPIQLPIVPLSVFW